MHGYLSSAPSTPPRTAPGDTRQSAASTALPALVQAPILVLAIALFTAGSVVPGAAFAQRAPASTPTAVQGDVVLSALRNGIARNADEKDPYGSGCRKLAAPDESAFWLCGAMASWQVRGGFPGSSGLGIWARVAVEPVISGTTVQGVSANGIRFAGPTIDFAATNPLLDATAASWSSGQWQVQLVVGTVPDKPALMRVCWNLTLPPPPPVTGPPGFQAIVRSEPLARMMCSLHDRAAPGPDRGGYVVDDIGAGVKRYEANW